MQIIIIWPCWLEPAFALRENGCLPCQQCQCNQTSYMQAVGSVDILSTVQRG